MKVIENQFLIVIILVAFALECICLFSSFLGANTAGVAHRLRPNTYFDMAPFPPFFFTTVLISVFHERSLIGSLLE